MPTLRIAPHGCCVFLQDCVDAPPRRPRGLHVFTPTAPSEAANLAHPPLATLWRQLDCSPRTHFAQPEAGSRHFWTRPRSALWTLSPVSPRSLRDGVPGDGVPRRRRRRDGVPMCASRPNSVASFRSLFLDQARSTVHVLRAYVRRMSEELLALSYMGRRKNTLLSLGIPDLQQCTFANALFPATPRMKGASGPWGQRVVSPAPVREDRRSHPALTPRRGRCAAIFPAPAPGSHTVPLCGREHIS
jgi:hypothetical protein